MVFRLLFLVPPLLIFLGHYYRGPSSVATHPPLFHFPLPFHPFFPGAAHPAHLPSPFVYLFSARKVLSWLRRSPVSFPVDDLFPQLAHLPSPQPSFRLWLSFPASPSSLRVWWPQATTRDPPSRHLQPQSSSHLLIPGPGLSHPFASREFE